MTVVVTGSEGRLAVDVIAALARREISAHGVTKAQLDVADAHAVRQVITRLRPSVIINTAAATDVDRCEEFPGWAFSVNAEAIANLLEAARIVGAHLVTISTDYVFDGTKAQPYQETDEPNPLSVYGASKLAGEQLALPEATVIRTAWLTSMAGPGVLRSAMLRLSAGETLSFVDDQVGSPTFTWDVAETIVDLVADRRPGLFHAVNAGATSWFGLVRELAERAGVDPHQVQAISTSELDPPRRATRPAYSVLDVHALRDAGYRPLRHYSEPLDEFVRSFR